METQKNHNKKWREADIERLIQIIAPTYNGTRKQRARAVKRAAGLLGRTETSIRQMICKLKKDSNYYGPPTLTILPGEPLPGETTQLLK